MTRIAAVCADPSGLNPGMLSVDLALACVMQALPGSNTLTYLNPKRPLRISDSCATLDYQGLDRAEELEHYDRIVYWGDFFHWLPYAHWDWLYDNPSVEAGQRKQQLLDRWYRVFLLENRVDDLGARVIVFGGTIYGMTARMLSDPRYQEALTSLYRAARLVAPRDTVSASLVQQMVPQQHYALGCDCAFLLDADAVLPMESARRWAVDVVPEKFVVCYFGRSGAAASLQRFAEMVAAHLGMRLVVLDWLGQPEGLGGLAFKLAVTQRAVLAITDTYHYTVTGWREGLAVIGVGRARARGGATLDDKKKEIFFRQILASDYYHYVEDIEAALPDLKALNNLVLGVVAAVADQGALALIRQTLANQVSSARRQLLAALGNSAPARAQT